MKFKVFTVMKIELMLFKKSLKYDNKLNNFSSQNFSIQCNFYIVWIDKINFYSKINFVASCHQPEHNAQLRGNAFHNVFNFLKSFKVTLTRKTTMYTRDILFDIFIDFFTP